MTNIKYEVRYRNRGTKTFSFWCNFDKLDDAIESADKLIDRDGVDKVSVSEVIISEKVVYGTGIIDK
jgi:hypothetical protein